MWEKLTDFLQAHYRAVLAVNLAALLFIGTAVFYGVNAFGDMRTYNEVIDKTDLEKTASADDWFTAEETTSAAEPTKPKQQVVAVELYDVISQFFPEGSVPDRKSLADAQSKAKAVSADKCYERFEKGFLNDDLTGSDYITLVSVHYSNVQSDTPEALCEVAKGENSYYFRLIFEKNSDGWQIADWKQYA